MWEITLKDGRIAIIREGRQNDADRRAVGKLHFIQLGAQFKMLGLPPKGIGELMTSFFDAYRDGFFDVFVAEIDGKIEAFIESTLPDVETIERANLLFGVVEERGVPKNARLIGNLWVEPDYREHGIGECLFLITILSYEPKLFSLSVLSEERDRMEKILTTLEKQCNMNVETKPDEYGLTAKLRKNSDTDERLKVLLKKKFGIEF